MVYSIKLLGTFQVRHDATTIDFRGAKVQALLAYLALESDRAHSRSVIAGLLWPELLEADALRNLTQALVRLRRALSSDDKLVRATRQALHWRAERAEVDVAQFEQLAQSSDPAALERAAQLYQGELLAGLNLPDCEAFEEWLLFSRERLREQALSVLQTLSEHYLTAGQTTDAAAMASRQLALDPLRETAHRQLMRAHAADRDRAGALAAYDRCVAILDDALGVPPDDETVQLAKRIHSGDPTLHVARPPRHAEPAAAHNLASPLTPLVGRDVELARLVELPNTPARLMTLVGAGGAGKSRLALEAAWRLLPRFRDGVWWVALAGIQPDDDPALQRETVAGAIAAALGVVMDGHRPPVDSIAEDLRGRATLLVLDNCEHLPQVPFVARAMLEATPSLQLLATSRAPLGITGEALLRLGGLAVPADDTADPADHAGVRLFLDCARRCSPGWGECPEHVVGAARLCRLLDGSPLGIELAANWVDHYSPQELAEMIQTDLDFLVARTFDLPDRQRSLRAVFESTWRLLPESERLALARLSVFRGSFNRAASLAVTGASAVALIRLTDKSLLAGAGAGRYSLHDLVRGFAAEQVRADQDTASIADLHAAYFLALAERAAPELVGPERARWMGELRGDLDNLRAALDWARARPQPELELRLASALCRFWVTHGFIAEGRERLEGAFARLDAVETPALVRALASGALGLLVNAQGDRERGETLLQQSVALYREAGDMLGLLDALNMLGGVAYDHGDLCRAAATWEECVLLSRAIANPGEEIRSLGNLGEARSHLGDLERGESLMEESIAIARQVGRADLMATQLGNLGTVRLRRGDAARAKGLIRQSLELNHALDDPRAVAIALENLAAVAVAERHLERAARLLGAAHAVRSSLGLWLPAPERGETEGTSAEGRRALGDVTWSELFEAGRVLPLDEAVAYALEDGGVVLQGRGRPSPTAATTDAADATAATARGRAGPRRRLTHNRLTR